MKVTVTDFQAIAQTSIDARGLTVIVGPSDRGKSALLRAIEAALFNRSGEFVRNGQRQAAVQLELNSTATHDGHTVTWTKGSGTNAFTVDGIDYSRVGRGAPPVLAEMGFRDVTIGAKLNDDGKFEGGETIRPQIADQFDPVFLLKKPGTFLNEVLLGLSRLNVLQRAGRLCSSDLRSAKSEAKSARAQLDVLTASRDRLADAPALAGRVVALVERMSRYDLQRAAQQRLVALQAQWAAARVQPPRPTAAPALSGRYARFSALRVMARQRAELQAAAAAPRPAQAAGLGQGGARLTAIIAVRKLAHDWRQYSRGLLDWSEAIDRHTEQLKTWGDELAALKLELRVCPTCGQSWVK